MLIAISADSTPSVVFDTSHFVVYGLLEHFAVLVSPGITAVPSLVFGAFHFVRCRLKIYIIPIFKIKNIEPVNNRVEKSGIIIFRG